MFNRLRRLSLPRKSVVRLNDRPDMTLDVYRGRKTTMQQQQQPTPMEDVTKHVKVELVEVLFYFFAVLFFHEMSWVRSGLLRIFLPALFCDHAKNLG